MNIVINKKEYTIGDSYRTLSIRQVEALFYFEHKSHTSNGAKNATSKEAASELLSTLSSMEAKIAQKVAPEEIEVLAIGLIDRINSEKCPDSTTSPESFRCDTEELFFPVAETSFDHERMSLHGITALQFCDASDLLQQNPMKYASLILAILCLAKNEHYEEAPIRERGKRFKQLPCSLAIAIINEIREAHRFFKTTFPHCYPVVLSEHNTINTQKLSHIEAISTPSWYELMLWCADYRPSEIQILEKMSLYTFMRILDCKIKHTHRP